MNKDKDPRGSLYLLTGVVIGIVLGLLYSLKIQPVKYIEAAPSALAHEYKQQYRSMIALAFQANGDTVRARARLDLLDDSDIYQNLTEQAQQTLAQNSQSEEARALGILAIELGKIKDPGEIDLFSGLLTTPGILATNTAPAAFITTESVFPPSSIPTPDASIVLVTPTAISADLFILQDLTKICEPRPSQPVFQIEALDRDNQPLPGVLIILSSQLGEERFYTGLSPDKGLGYAEFHPTPGAIYSLRLEEDGIPIQDLTAAECQSSSGEIYPGSWLFEFIKSTN